MGRFILVQQNVRCIQAWWRYRIMVRGFRRLQAAIKARRATHQFTILREMFTGLQVRYQDLTSFTMTYVGLHEVTFD